PGKQCGLAAAGDYLPSLRSPWLSAAAIDRIIHHATILEIDGDSYRRKHQKKSLDCPPISAIPINQ
ncbi:ATP-binding protein, partial [Thiolapillus sp.]